MTLPRVWAVIPGFPDYAISTYGEVRNIRLARNLKGAVRKSNGLMQVILYRDVGSDKRQRLYRGVHHLVVQAFYSKYRFVESISHIDGDPTNNRLDNLRALSGRSLGDVVLDHPPVMERWIRIVETGELYRSIKEVVKRINGDQAGVTRVLTGEWSQHKGYSFTYYYRPLKGDPKNI